MPSTLSKIPPCPGRSFPVSLRNDFLFKKERKRSPIWQAKDVRTPTSKISGLKFSIRKFIAIIKKKDEVKIDPIAPEIVLLGLILDNFGPLNNFPKTKPPISDATQVVKITKMIIFK